MPVPLHFFRARAASIGFQYFPLPAPLEKLTTRPRALLTSGRNVLVISISPHRFTSAVLLYMVSGVHSIGSLCTIPALFTRPHSLPKNYIFKSRHPSNSLTKTECPEWKGMVQFPFSESILFWTPVSHVEKVCVHCNPSSLLKVHADHPTASRIFAALQTGVKNIWSIHFS